MNDLKPGERIRVHTRNSVYSLMMVRPGERKILIRGGKHFPQTTRAYLWDVLATGQSMVVAIGDECVVTSPVLALHPERRTTVIRLPGVERRKQPVSSPGPPLATRLTA